MSRGDSAGVDAAARAAWEQPLADAADLAERRETAGWTVLFTPSGGDHAGDRHGRRRARVQPPRARRRRRRDRRAGRGRVVPAVRASTVHARPGRSFSSSNCSIRNGCGAFWSSRRIRSPKLPGSTGRPRETVHSGPDSAGLPRPLSRRPNTGTVRSSSRQTPGGGPPGLTTGATRLVRSSANARLTPRGGGDTPRDDTSALNADHRRSA